MISTRNWAASAPSATRWSVERVAFIIWATASSPSRTTGCSFTVPTANTAAWGGKIMAVSQEKSCLAELLRVDLLQVGTSMILPQMI